MVLRISIMRNSWDLNVLAIFAASVLLHTPARAQYLDEVGVTTLRAVTTNLDGTGIHVGQPEANNGDNGSTNAWEVNPTSSGVLQPASLFTYFYGNPPFFTVSSASTYPNSLGSESGHADTVAGIFYGIPNGVATNVAHVDNYDANTFVNYYVFQGHTIAERIVNQSFTFGTYDTGVDTNYDNYAAQNNVLFLSGLAGSPLDSPATCYNGIGVGSTNSPSGPTADGRSKPDLIAPDHYETSYTTPQVAGAAAILLQAGLRGDGGNSTNAATDIRTVKALLLNGAVKPADWMNVAPSPLDARYGAGVLNVFNSYEQLAGGKHGYIVSAIVPANNSHPPTGATGTVGVLNGWDFNTNSSNAYSDGVNHYYFNVTNGVGNSPFTATATLVWNRQKNQTGINNLDLFLYDALSSNLIASSTSLVDNVQHLWLPQLPQGRYDLQVLKKGGATVSLKETYALAWTFFSQSLYIVATDTNVTLAWPAYPAGFRVEATADLALPAVWTTNDLPMPVIANGSNYIFLNATNSAQFYRLSWPNL
jgi:hypothetical protein